MTFDRRSFLKALDASETLRRYLEEKRPKEMYALSSFRKNMGDNCNYVTVILRKIWYDEVEHGDTSGEYHFRAAGLTR